MKIAFLASHNGSAAKAITQACINGHMAAVPALLISNNPDGRALEWAKELKLKTAVINAKNAADPDKTIADLLADNGIDLVVCSGYMKLIGPESHQLRARCDFGNASCIASQTRWQRHVRTFCASAVFDQKLETGITIHLVDGEYDTGTSSHKRLPVCAGVRGRYQLVKPPDRFYIETLQKILSGDISLR